MSYEDDTQSAMEVERNSVDESDDSDQSEDELMEMLSLLLILRRRRKKKDQNKKKKPRRNPRFWVRDIYQLRSEFGEYHRLIQELRNGDREYFFRYFRMSPDRFHHLLGLVSPLITKKDTTLRKAISAEERLAVTLRFLATGDSQHSLSFSFRMGKATVSKIVAETSNAIYEVLKEEYLAVEIKNRSSMNICSD